MKLSHQPKAAVKVTVSSADDGAVKVKDGSSYGKTVDLTFSTSNWNTAQTVTVQAVDDGDTSGESVVLSHSADGVYAGVTKDLTVSVDDNDTVGLELNKTALTVAEGGTGSYTVKLKSEPTSTVTVAVSSDNTAAVQLKKTGGSYGDTVELTLDPSGGDYESVSNSTATVTVTDNDDTPTIQLSVDKSTVSEGDGGPTVTVTATIGNNSRFASDQSVSIEVGATGDSATEGTDYTTVNTLTLSLAKDAASGTKGFTLTLSDDAVAEGAESIAVSGTLSGFTVSPTTVTINDNETLSFTLSKSSLSLSEGGADGSYTVKLSHQPKATVKVTVSSADDGAVQLSKDAGSNYADSVTLTFTTSTWSTAQTVTVQAQSDADGNDESVQITNTAGSNYDDASAAVALTITDDEDNALELNKTALTVAEGSTGSYTVKLKSQPTATVTVTVSSADTGAVQLSKDAGSNYADSVTLTFTSSDWETAQTVTVQAQSDADGSDESVQITNTAGSN